MPESFTIFIYELSLAGWLYLLYRNHHRLAARMNFQRDAVCALIALAILIPPVIPVILLGALIW